MDSFFLLIPILLLCPFLSSSKPLLHQTFIPSSLPAKPSLTEINSQTTWTISSTETTDASSTDEHSSSTFLLQHIDAFSSETSPQSLFLSRLQRDAARVDHLTRTQASSSSSSSATITNTNNNGDGFSSGVISGLPQGSGEYFTRLGMGTPATYYYFILDTGSDIIWVQCQPCVKCYKQSDPIFDPSKSSTFRHISCASPLCPKPDGFSFCGRPSRSCGYGVSYGDGSATAGDFVQESLVFGKREVKNIALGCGYNNTGLFVGAAGLLGLGRGGLALPGQMTVKRLFSYCLANRNSASNNGKSTVIFGDSGVYPSSIGYIPLVKNTKTENFYYLGMTGLGVGGAGVEGVKESMFKVDVGGNGGVIIDSGTSVTRLTESAYIPFRDAFRSRMGRFGRPTRFLLFDTCYDFRGEKTVQVPNVEMQFGGVKVELPAANYMVPVDNKGSYCFAFAPVKGMMSIIGNIQQQGFRIVYDLENSRVGFMAAAC